MTEFGIVKFFNAKADKNYGFVTVLDADGNPTAEELFFHLGDGQCIVHDGYGPTFIDGDTATRKGYTLRDVPKKGDEIVFERDKSRKGPKASPWGYTAVWAKTYDWLDARPLIRLVREEQNLTERPDGNWETSIVWEGRNVFELSTLHLKRRITPKGKKQSRVYDSLDDPAEDKAITRKYHFEAQVNDEWQPCEDPRVFICCVPPHVFEWYATEGMRQGVCIH